MAYVAIQTEIPKIVGTKNASKVHFMLPVSFLTVRRVVEQGQWNREKRMVFIAVSVVHPFSMKRSFICVRDKVSVTVPCDKYAITITGITISLAGKPRIKARRMTPSSPISCANGSKNPDACAKSVFPPTDTFAKIHITSPAGAATAMARPKTNRVLSKQDRTITFKTSGFRYGGSSNVKEVGSPFKRVFDKMPDTKKVASIPVATKPVSMRVESMLPPEPVPEIKNIVIREIRVGKRPLQGTKVFVRIAIRRSLLESIILAPVTPTALQPKPIHIVRACFPQAEHFLKHLSRLKAILGRYPRSSKSVKRGKNIAIGGSITEITQVKI